MLDCSSRLWTFKETNTRDNSRSNDTLYVMSSTLPRTHKPQTRSYTVNIIRTQLATSPQTCLSTLKSFRHQLNLSVAVSLSILSWSATHSHSPPHTHHHSCHSHISNSHSHFRHSRHSHSRHSLPKCAPTSHPPSSPQPHPPHPPSTTSQSELH